MVNEALAYAKRGWYVFPCGAGKDKKAPLTQHGLKDASVSDIQIKEWWGKWPDAAIGIVTGKVSGITVVDIDPRHGGDRSLTELEAKHGDLPPTAQVLTGGSGGHFYFNYTAKIKTTSNLFPGIDIRNDGAYVIAPPSVHITGNKYQWLADQSPDELPLALVPDWLMPQNKATQPLPAIIEHGGRNTLLASLAGSMRKRGASQRAIYKALQEENVSRCIPPLEAREINAIASSVAKYDPAPRKTPFVSLDIGKYRLSAARVNKIASTGVRAAVSLASETRVELSDIVNLSKDKDRQRFAAACPADIKEFIAESIMRLEKLMVDEVIAAGPEAHEGSRECNGLIETDTGYVRMADDGARIVATGVITPVARITTPNGEVVKATVLGTEIYIPRRSWDSKKEWLKNFDSADFHFFGSDIDVQCILGIITNCYTVPHIEGSDVIGKFKDTYLFPTGVIDKDGWQKEPKYMYVPSGNSSLENAFAFSTVADTRKLIHEVCTGLTQMNRMETIMPIIGVKFAQPFTPQIREAVKSFPILFGFGSSGAGKTCTCEIFRRVFGLKPKGLTAGGTAFTYLRMGSSTNCVGITYDEQKESDMTQYQKDNLLRFLRNVYDGNTDIRGTKGLGDRKFEMIAPVEVYGEQFISENALLQRMIPVYFNVNSTTSGTYTKIYHYLSDLELEAFAEPYYKWCCRQDFAALFHDAEEVAQAYFKKLSSKLSRVKRNLTVMIFGILAFRKFASDNGLGLPSTDLTTTFNEVLAQVNTFGDKPMCAFDQFIQQLAIMPSRRMLERGVHYDYDEDNLYIHLASCVSAFREFARVTNYPDEVHRAIDYRRQAEENKQGGGYITELDHLRRLKEKSEIDMNIRRCIVINKSIVSSLLDVSGLFI